MDENSILVFDRPVILKDEQNNEWMAYGYVYDSTICFADAHDYVRYLVGIEKWLAIGNISNADKTWTDSKTGITYTDKDDFIKEFCWNAFDDNPVSFFCKKNITFSIPKDCAEDSFIISEDYWRVALNMILDLNVAEQRTKQIEIERHIDADKNDIQ